MMAREKEKGTETEERCIFLKSSTLSYNLKIVFNLEIPIGIYLYNYFLREMPLGNT